MSSPTGGFAGAGYIGSAEPSWAAVVSARQLAGLLNLSCLLSEKILLSDVHLGDNRHFVESFLRRNPSGLYSRIRGLAEAGCVQLLLRDRSIRPTKSPSGIDIDSFSDVYRSWMLTDPMAAWINQELGEGRLRYFHELDSWARDAVVRRYTYDIVKRQFMQNVNRAFNSESSVFYTTAYRMLPDSIKNAYNNIRARDWFTLSDIYSVLQEAGLPYSHEMMLYHGLLNEVSYSQITRASLVGTDIYDKPLVSGKVLCNNI